MVTLRALVTMRLTVFLSLALAIGVHGHGAMTFPRPRNAADGELANWTSWAYPCDESHKGNNCRITFCEDGKDCEGSCPYAGAASHLHTLRASAKVCSPQQA